MNVIFAWICSRSLRTIDHFILHTRQFFFGTLSLSSHPFIFLLSFVKSLWASRCKILFLLLCDKSCHSPEPYMLPFSISLGVRIGNYFDWVWFETKFGFLFGISNIISFRWGTSRTYLSKRKKIEKRNRLPWGYKKI